MFLKKCCNSSNLGKESVQKISGRGKSQTMLSDSEGGPRTYKDLKEKILLYIKGYCNTSTFHGLRYIFKSDQLLFERYLWFFVILLLISGLVSNVISQYRNYFNRPIIMSINGTGTPVGDIPFPALTFCSDNYMPESVLNISELLMISRRRNLSENERNRLECAALLCRDSDSEPFLPRSQLLFDLKRATAMHNIGFMLHLQKCYSFTKSIVWVKKVLEPGCSVMQYTIVGFRQCLTFNMLPGFSLFTERFIRKFVDPLKPGVIESYPFKYKNLMSSWSPDTGFKNKSENILLRISGSSLINSMNFMLDFRSENIQKFCRPRSYGFTVIVHSPAEYPSLIHPSIYAEVDKRTMLQITPKLIQTHENLRHWKPEERGCYYSHERSLQFFGIYTSNNCEIECEANITYQQCGCNIPDQPRFASLPVCASDQLKCTSEFMQKLESAGRRHTVLFSSCNCLPACSEISYSFESMVQPRNWTFNTETYHILPDETKRNSYVNVLAFYRSRKVNGIVRVGKLLLTDFIAAVGSVMCLFFGFTLLSIFELFYYFSIRWITDIWKTNKCSKNFNCKPTGNINVKKSVSTLHRGVSDGVTETPEYLPFNL